MAFKLLARTREQTGTTGTGNIVVSGVVSGDNVRFASGMSIGDTTYMCVVSGDGVAWEEFLGTYSAANTIQRTTTLINHLGTTAHVSLTGTSRVFAILPGDFVSLFNQLGLGDTTKFLRGDGTFAAVSGGAGGILYSDLIDDGVFINTDGYVPGEFVEDAGLRYLNKAAITPSGLNDTWDATFGSTKWTVGGTGNLTATAIDHNHTDTIIGTIPHTTGKFYVEFVSGATGDDRWVGIATAAMTNATLLGTGLLSLGFHNDGNWRFNSTLGASGMGVPANGNIIGLMFDLAGHAYIRNVTANPALWFGNNGSADPVAGTNGFPFTAFGAPAFVAATSNQNGGDEIFVYQDGSGTFGAAAPSGSNAWGGSGTVSPPASDPAHWIKTGAAGSMATLISALAAANSASLAWTGLPALAATYMLVGRLLIPATNTAALQLQFGTGVGPTYATSNYETQIANYGDIPNSGNSGSTGQSALPIGAPSGSNSSPGSSFSHMIHTDQSTYASLHGTAHWKSSDTHFYTALIGGSWVVSAPITAIRVLFSSGNITSGTVALYQMAG